MGDIVSFFQRIPEIVDKVAYYFMIGCSLFFVVKGVFNVWKSRLIQALMFLVLAGRSCAIKPGGEDTEFFLFEIAVAFAVCSAFLGIVSLLTSEKAPMVAHFSGIMCSIFVTLTIFILPSKANHQYNYSYNYRHQFFELIPNHTEVWKRVPGLCPENATRYLVKWGHTDADYYQITFTNSTDFNCTKNPLDGLKSHIQAHLGRMMTTGVENTCVAEGGQMVFNLTGADKMRDNTYTGYLYKWFPSGDNDHAYSWARTPAKFLVVVHSNAANITGEGVHACDYKSVPFLLSHLLSYEAKAIGRQLKSLFSWDLTDSSGSYNEGGYCLTRDLFVMLEMKCFGNTAMAKCNLHHESEFCDILRLIDLNKQLEVATKTNLEKSVQHIEALLNGVINDQLIIKNHLRALSSIPYCNYSKFWYLEDKFNKARSHPKCWMVANGTYLNITKMSNEIEQASKELFQEMLLKDYEDRQKSLPLSVTDLFLVTSVFMTLSIFLRMLELGDHRHAIGGGCPKPHRLRKNGTCKCGRFSTPQPTRWVHH
nr:glycoprotein [plateau pika virus]